MKSAVRHALLFAACLALGLLTTSADPPCNIELDGYCYKCECKGDPLAKKSDHEKPSHCNDSPRMKCDTYCKDDMCRCQPHKGKH